MWLMILIHITKLNLNKSVGPKNCGALKVACTFGTFLLNILIKTYNNVVLSNPPFFGLLTYSMYSSFILRAQYEFQE